MARYRNLRSLPLLLAAALLLLSPIKSRALDDSSVAEIEQLFREFGITAVEEEQPIEGKVRDLQGKEVDLSAFRGKVAFLTFWTTWCPSCDVEMPALQKIYARYRDHGFQILAVNIDEPAARVSEYFRAKGLSYMPLLDPRGQVARRFGVWSIPATFITDRRGVVLGKLMGARHWDTPQGNRLLQLLLTNH